MTLVSVEIDAGFVLKRFSMREIDTPSRISQEATSLAATAHSTRRFSFFHSNNLTIAHPLVLNGCAPFYPERDKRLS
jgi:hypothetical protein